MPFCDLTLRFQKPQQFRGVPETLGEHLKKRRLELGLRQKDVAQRLDVSPWTVLNWEANKRTPSRRLQRLIMRFLGYEP